MLCRSAARTEKERAMLQRQSDRLAEALGRIAVWLERHPQSDHEAVGRRTGGHQRGDRRPKGSPAERCLPAAHQLRGDGFRAIVALVCPAHVGRGRVSHREERLGPAARLSPNGGPRAGPHPGLLPGIGAVAHARAVGASQAPRHVRGGNWSGSSRASKASTCSCRYNARASAPSCACAWSHLQTPRQRNCWPTSACACPQARTKSAM